MLRQGGAKAASKRVTLVACSTLALALFPAAAQAAPQTIDFDALEEGAKVTSQYEAQGLRFARASELGQPAIEGDCGDPTVSSAEPAASEPNYAVLGSCASGVGSYGALLDTSSSLSVRVRTLTVGASAHVELIGFAADGTEVARGAGDAPNSSWESTSATLDGKGQISYFVIRASGGASVGIDDLSYETPAEEPKKGIETTTSPPPASTPPTAALALQTPNATAGEPITLSGAASTPGSGRIISYGWDFNDDGKIDTSTGASPTAQLLLGPGSHTVGLTVTTSTGERSTSKLLIDLPATKIHPPDGGEGECLPTLEIGDAHLLAECIQKLAGGGYVIAGSELSINGMVLVPEGTSGSLKIRTVKNYAIDGTETQLYGGRAYVELLNTPIGNVVLGERDLEAEPIDLEVHSALPSTKVVFDGEHARAASEKPTKTLLMAIGVGKACEGKEAKKAGCCPPKNGLTACGTLPGEFPLEGQVDVYLTSKGQALFEAQVGLTLKSVDFEATGQIGIVANLETGIELSSLQFTIPEASLAPIFKVKKASFVYYFPEYYEESKRDSWQAKGTITFGEEIAELEAELAFKKGQFQSAGMKFKASKGGIPVYPGILLNEIGASLGVNPLTFGGSLGASISETLELELEFKYREATEKELGFFGGQGTLSLKSDKIATLAADVYSDGYVDAAVNFNLHFPFEGEPIIELSGGAGFWDEPSSGLWQAKGNVYLKLWIISAEAAALVNNEFAAGCVHVGAEGVFGGGIQGRYKFADGSVSGGLFGNDNCSDQLKPYAATAKTKHSGGFVKEESLRAPFWAIAAEAGGEYDSFHVPVGALGEEMRVSSSSGTPSVVFLSPGGKQYASPTAAGQLVTVPGQFMSAIGPDPHELLVLLRHPEGGEWRVEPTSGAPAIEKLETAQDVAPATVEVHVEHARRHSCSLAYEITRFLPGTRVRFVERGSDSTHVLGTVSRSKGRLSFIPMEALGRSRKILAYMLDAEGAPVRELTVGSYSAPRAFEPGPPKRLRFARHGSRAVLSWGAVPGARSYRIVIRGSNGRLETLTRTRTRSVAVANVLPFQSFEATVVAVGGRDRLRGKPASVKLKALEPRHKPKRSERRG